MYQEITLSGAGPASSQMAGRGGANMEGGARALPAVLLRTRPGAPRRHGAGAVQSAAGGGGDFPSGSQVSASSPTPSALRRRRRQRRLCPSATSTAASDPPWPAGRGTVVVDVRPASEKVSSRPAAGAARAPALNPRGTVTAERPPATWPTSPGAAGRPRSPVLLSPSAAEGRHLPARRSREKRPGRVPRGSVRKPRVQAAAKGGLGGE